jgi:hypothetical protein
MDFSLSFAAWAAIGAVGLAPVGALFGAAAGAVARSGGRSPGGALGRAAVDFFGRAWRAEFSPVAAGAIAGGVDGALFLGCIGLVVGLIAGYSGPRPDGRILVIAVVGAFLLALGAVAFGLLSHGLCKGGRRGLLGFAATGIGGLLGLSLAGAAGAGWGLMAGAVVGGVGMLVHGPEEAAAPLEDEEMGSHS